MSNCGSPGCEELNVSLIATGVYTSRNISWFDSYSDGASDKRYINLTKIGETRDSSSYNYGDCSAGSSESAFTWTWSNTWNPVVDDKGEIIKGWRAKIQGSSSYGSNSQRKDIGNPEICCEGQNQSNSKYSLIWNYPEMQTAVESCQGGTSSSSSCGDTIFGPPNCDFIGGSETQSSVGGEFTISNVQDVCNESAERKIEIAKLHKQRYHLFGAAPIMHPYISESEIIIQYFNFIPSLTTDQKDYFNNNYSKASGRIVFIHELHTDKPIC